MKENIFTGDNEDYLDRFNKPALHLLCSVILPTRPLLLGFEFAVPSAVSAHELFTTEHTVAGLLGAIVHAQGNKKHILYGFSKCLVLEEFDKY